MSFMSGILGGIESGVAAASGIEERRAQRLLNRQAGEEVKQGEQDSAFKAIQAADDKGYMKLNEGRAVSINAADMYFDDAEEGPTSGYMGTKQRAIIDLLNSKDEFKIARDDNGKTVRVEAAGIVRNEDDTYSIIVKREDGKMAPLTEGRSSQGDDVVVRLTKKQLNDRISGLAEESFVRGAMANPTTYMRGSQAVSDEFLTNVLHRMNAVKKVYDETGGDTAAATAVYGMMSEGDPEVSKEIVEDFGADLTPEQKIKMKALRQQNAQHKGADGGFIPPGGAPYEESSFATDPDGEVARLQERMAKLEAELNAKKTVTDIGGGTREVDAVADPQSRAAYQRRIAATQKKIDTLTSPERYENLKRQRQSDVKSLRDKVAKQDAIISDDNLTESEKKLARAKKRSLEAEIKGIENKISVGAQPDKREQRRLYGANIVRAGKAAISAVGDVFDGDPTVRRDMLGGVSTDEDPYATVRNKPNARTKPEGTTHNGLPPSPKQDNRDILNEAPDIKLQPDVQIKPPRPELQPNANFQTGVASIEKKVEADPQAAQTPDTEQTIMSQPPGFQLAPSTIKSAISQGNVASPEQINQARQAISNAGITQASDLVARMPPKDVLSAIYAMASAAESPEAAMNLTESMLKMAMFGSSNADEWTILNTNTQAQYAANSAASLEETKKMNEYRRLKDGATFRYRVWKDQVDAIKASLEYTDEQKKDKIKRATEAYDELSDLSEVVRSDTLTENGRKPKKYSMDSVNAIEEVADKVNSPDPLVAENASMFLPEMVSQLVFSATATSGAAPFDLGEHWTNMFRDSSSYKIGSAGMFEYASVARGKNGIKYIQFRDAKGNIAKDSTAANKYVQDMFSAATYDAFLTALENRDRKRNTNAAAATLPPDRKSK
jgi:hypothetical protein